jgi:hypothetical protein
LLVGGLDNLEKYLIDQKRIEQDAYAQKHQLTLIADILQGR